MGGERRVDERPSGRVGVVCTGVIHSVSATSGSAGVACFMAPVFTV